MKEIDSVSLLRFRSFRKRYGDYLVIEADALDFQPGIHMVIGPNGSGKTTLLKSLAGMIAFEGEILLNDGISLNRDHLEHRRRVNYCEAEPVFPGFLAGSHLIELFVKTKNGSEQQVEYLREMLGIGDYLAQKVGAYSSGMKKKLALLLAFLGEPALILLDEPLTTLDPQVQPRLVKLIQNYAQEGTSFLLASHQAIGIDGLEIEASWMIENHSVRTVGEADLRDWFHSHITEN